MLSRTAAGAHRVAAVGGTPADNAAIGDADIPDVAEGRG